MDHTAALIMGREWLMEIGMLTAAVRRRVCALIWALVVCLPAWPGLCESADRPNEAPDIGSRRELFVDNFLIDKMEGVRLQLNRTRPAETALKFDKPWENNVGYFTVIKDRGVYRMYYVTRADPGGRKNPVICYAESKDAITWTKPDLGLFEVSGTRKNNVVILPEAIGPDSRAFGNFVPFLDSRPGAPAEERFKGLGGTGVDWGGPGLCAYVSADGIHWKLKKKSVFTKGRFDSQNIAFWSPSEKRYVCYFRTLRYYGAPRKSGKRRYARWISRTTSKDFLNWTDPVEMETGDKAPFEHFYINGTHPYFRAPHIYVALAGRAPGCRALTKAERKKVQELYPAATKFNTETVLMTTRGGNRYTRLFKEGFVRPGPDFRDWSYGSQFAAVGIIQTSPSEMSIYVMKHSIQRSAYLQRRTLRLDGFVSVNAPYSGGEMITKPFRFRGKELTLNFATSAVGYVQVEIQDAAGAAVRGFGLSRGIVGDRIEWVVTWKGKSDVSKLAGKPVRLRFKMKDADLYSIRFR